MTSSSWTTMDRPIDSDELFLPFDEFPWYKLTPDDAARLIVAAAQGPP
jgi:hypothetical protein